MNLPRPPQRQQIVRANLCFIRRGDELLLIRKKRGLGAGKINGPGGKVEPGETARESAIRETFEELGVTPLDPAQIGELEFDFRDGLRLHCAVFVAHNFAGEPRETAEAIPLWTHVDAVPYHEMWADDRHWLPSLIAGQRFRAWFSFDGEELLEKRLELLGVGDEFRETD
ncbi:MAG: 8-oxo-dGTP diphosphatase [Verrucomicrobiota bacterium]|nr:8-oxo-dGTP diphosphatase [Verrucomicrobiota bacterium]